tara:strand:+ start:440 stop:1588 length:1149 start_codon:yes stop_codon:yes gene_type:complete
MDQNHKKTYFDIAATTPLNSEVANLMHEINTDFFGNPSSIHQFGQKAHNILEKSRKTICSILGCKESEIFFTSGGTESNNIVLNSALKKGDHLITSSYEHPAVLKVANNLELKGVDVTYVDPNTNGIIELESIQKAINDNTKLISIMYVNNELGTINPIKEISKLCKQKNILFHTDAVQYIGKLPFNLLEYSIDFLSIAAHKFYGPKSIGALYMANGNNIDPLFIGGGQEKGIRPGTENIALIAGMCKALELSYNSMDENIAHITSMEKILIAELDKHNINYKINGSLRVPGILNITFHDIDGQTLLMNLDMVGVAISYGSACASGSSKPSSALLSIGIDNETAQKSVRISIGRFIKKEDVINLVHSINSFIPNKKEEKSIG